MSCITRPWRCNHPISDNISESPPRKESVIKSKSSSQSERRLKKIKLAKSFKYYIRLIPSALSHVTGYMYAVFCLTESCLRCMYVYSSFKWWIFSSVYFLCNHSTSHQIVGTYQCKIWTCTVHVYQEKVSNQKYSGLTAIINEGGMLGSSCF